jgi:hypothetical protein
MPSPLTFFFLDVESYYVARANCELLIFLPQPPGVLGL